MKTNVIYFMLVVFTLFSCQKEELYLLDTVDGIESDAIEVSAKSTQDRIVVTVTKASSPSINGEVELMLNKTYSFPITVQFKIKDCMGVGYNLVSVEYTIPENTRYQKCDIDEFIKSSPIGGGQGNSNTNGFTPFFVTHGSTFTSSMIPVYLQIYKVTASTSIQIDANCSILMVKPTSSGVEVSYPYKGGAVAISLLENTPNHLFYKPTSTTPNDPIGPVNPRLPRIPIDLP